MQWCHTMWTVENLTSSSKWKNNGRVIYVFIHFASPKLPKNESSNKGIIIFPSISHIFSILDCETLFIKTVKSVNRWFSFYTYRYNCGNESFYAIKTALHYLNYVLVSSPIFSLTAKLVTMLNLIARLNSLTFCYRSILNFKFYVTLVIFL